jgi:hypothetical protein
VGNQKNYKHILDNQEKIKIRQPERQFKPYESPERVSFLYNKIRKSPPRAAQKVAFATEAEIDKDY